MIKSKLLLSQMVLKNVSMKNLADAQGWSMTTAYRKINGKTEFTQSEIQVVIRVLNLESAMANEIFFAPNLAFRQNEGVSNDD